MNSSSPHASTVSPWFGFITPVLLLVLSLAALDSYAQNAGNSASVEELPELNSYKGKYRLGIEVELKQEAFAKLLPFFDIVPPLNPSDSEGGADSRNHRLEALYFFQNIALNISRLKLRSDAPVDFKKVWQRLNKHDDREVIEFTYPQKYIVTNPEKYLHDLSVIAKYSGITQKLNAPLDITIPGPWFSYHNHKSYLKSKKKSVTNMVDSLNVLKAFEYSTVGRAAFAVDGEFSSYKEIIHKGQVRVFEDGTRFETRRQSLSPKDELRRDLYLMDVSEDRALVYIAEQISRNFTRENVEELFSNGYRRRVGDYQLNSDLFSKAMYRMAVSGDRTKVKPDALQVVLKAFGKKIPTSAFMLYASMRDADKQYMRKLFLMQPTLHVHSHGRDEIKTFLNDAIHDFSREELIEVGRATRSDPETRDYFTKVILPKIPDADEIRARIDLPNSDSSKESETKSQFRAAEVSSRVYVNSQRRGRCSLLVDRLVNHPHAAILVPALATAIIYPPAYLGVSYWQKHRKDHNSNSDSVDLPKYVEMPNTDALREQMLAKYKIKLPSWISPSDYPHYLSILQAMKKSTSTIPFGSLTFDSWAQGTPEIQINRDSMNGPNRIEVTGMDGDQFVKSIEFLEGIDASVLYLEGGNANSLRVLEPLREGLVRESRKRLFKYVSFYPDSEQHGVHSNVKQGYLRVSGAGGDLLESFKVSEEVEKVAEALRNRGYNLDHSNISNNNQGIKSLNELLSALDEIESSLDGGILIKPPLNISDSTFSSFSSIDVHLTSLDDPNFGRILRKWLQSLVVPKEDIESLEKIFKTHDLRSLLNSDRDGSYVVNVNRARKELEAMGLSLRDFVVSIGSPVAVDSAKLNQEESAIVQGDSKLTEEIVVHLDSSMTYEDVIAAIFKAMRTKPIP